MAALISPRTWALLDPLSDTNLNAGIRDAIAQLLPVSAFKSGDTIRVSTTTISADPHLVIPVAANAAYKIDLHLIYQQGTVGQLTVGFTAPASATLDWSVIGLVPSVTSSDSGSVTMQSLGIADLRTVGGAITSTVVNGDGRLVVSSTAGNLTLRWGPSASSATGTTLKQGSYLIAEQIA